MLSWSGSILRILRIFRKSPPAVERDEPLGRFLFSKAHFSRERRRVKPGAFVPPADGRLSVYRTRDLNEQQVWEIGHGAARSRSATLYGRGEVTPAEVWEYELDVDPDDQPKHHATIVGWPPEKDRRLSIAQKLAAGAVLKLV